MAIKRRGGKVTRPYMEALVECRQLFLGNMRDHVDNKKPRGSCRKCGMERQAWIMQADFIHWIMHFQISLTIVCKQIFSCFTQEYLATIAKLEFIKLELIIIAKAY